MLLIDMKLEIFALCDAATVSGGKLKILGAFDSVFAAQAPVVHSQCALSIRLRFSRIEEGEHRIRITVVDEDGHSIMPNLDGKLGVKFGSDEDSVVANFIVNIQQLKLERFGSYSIDLAVDGRHETSLPLVFKQVNAVSQGT